MASVPVVRQRKTDIKQFKIFLSFILALGLATFITPAQSQQTVPAVTATAFAAPAGEVQAAKPAPARRWADKIERRGLPNFHKVSDVYYRGAEPDAAGFRELKAMGIKTVIDLRFFHSDKKEIKDIGLGYEKIRFNTWHPEDEDVVKFLKIMIDKSKQPVFVHCRRGADRTGMMTAIYRMAIQNWPKEEALKEMRNEDFGFTEFSQNIVDYLEDIDPATLFANAQALGMDLAECGRL